MTLPFTLPDLRRWRGEAHQRLQVAKEDLDRARDACVRFIRTNPPKSFRLQEAYLNSDGTYATPHWDEVSAYTAQLLIDFDELDELIIREGEWDEVYHNEADDPRPGCRRVIEVQW